MRAGYGETLRQYLIKYNPLILIDLGPDIFSNATVDTNILLISREDNQRNTLALTKSNKQKTLKEELSQESTKLPNLTKGSWFIGSPWLYFILKSK